MAVAMVIAGALFFAACQRDRTPPTVSLINPAANTVTMGHILIQARAFDNKDVPVVEFDVDDVFKGVDSLGSDSVYSFVWDATAEAMGSQHQIKARTIDLAGNSKTSEAVTITIGIPAGPTNHRGGISYPETWDPAGNPHIVTGNLTVNSFLTLKPGVEIKVDPGFYFKIGAAGGILARGTVSSGILMSSNAAAPAPGDWEGLEVGAGVNGDSVVLEYCTFEYGGKDTTDAVVVLRSSPATVAHCTIRNGPGYGLWLASDNARSIEATTITANHRYALRIDTRYARVIGDGSNFAGNGRGVELVGGLLDQDAQWFDPLTPYVLTTDLHLGGTTPTVLTVKAGVTIRFRPGTGVTVGQDSSHFGGFIVQGTPTQPVTLTSDSSFPHPGDWKGISYGHLTSSDQAKLANCAIEYAGGYGAAVVCDSASARIADCTIRYSSGYGVKINKTGFARFEGNTVGLNLSYPVAVEPDFVNSVGANHLDQGLFISGGFLRNSATWSYSGYPHVVGGIIEIGGPLNPVLRVVDYDTVVFAGVATLRVGSVAAGIGGLYCQSACLVGASQVVGAWKGVEFREQALSAASGINNSAVKFGGGDSLGNIVCIGSSPAIAGNDIAYSAAWGIYLYNSLLNPDTLRANNTFHDNTLGSVGPGGP